MEITADRDVCVAAGMCVRTAPAYFDQATDDGRVVVLREKIDPDDVDEVLEAVKLCPSGALTLANVGEPGSSERV